MIDLPEMLVRTVTAALAEIGDPTPIVQAEALSGGCINNARRVTTHSGTYFLKWSSQVPAGSFQAEAHGLNLIRSTGAIRVPTILAVNDPSTADTPAFLLLEWLAPLPGFPEGINFAVLGESLARLHQAAGEKYGLERNNFIGPTPQDNGWEEDWIRFFRDQRLRPQIELARRLRTMTRLREQQFERLTARLEQWLTGVSRRPALLHGDLWVGNVRTGPHGEPVLIDPAVYYGDREAEIAYTELFGGFTSHFYHAYQQAWPLEPGYPDRRDLYNLYHLLNHLNLFGESYALQIDSILRRYVG